MTTRKSQVIVSIIVILALLVGAYVAKRLIFGGAAVQSKQQIEATQIVQLVNVERRLAHLQPLRRDPVLDTLAVSHTKDMLARNYFEHDAPGGPTFEQRFHAIHPRRMLGEENIAWGSGPYGTARGLVESWMASPPHRANILNPGVRRIGVGIATGKYQGQPVATVGTQDFSS